MPQRPPDEQDLHDRVIRAINARLTSAGRIAHTNPGPVRMVAIDGLYPDLILSMVHERADIVEAIYEIETASTVERQHAEAEWVPFSKIGVTFYLVVPADRFEEARCIADNVGIKAVLVGFEVAGDGVVTFDQDIVPAP